MSPQQYDYGQEPKVFEIEDDYVQVCVPENWSMQKIKALVIQEMKRNGWEVQMTATICPRHPSWRHYIVREERR